MLALAWQARGHRRLDPRSDSDFKQARVVMRAVEFAQCLCIPGALGFEWVVSGWAAAPTPSLTKSLNERELRAILGPVPEGEGAARRQAQVGAPGAVRPPPARCLPAVARRHAPPLGLSARARTLRRWCGYILLEPDAELQYSTETKELTFVLNAGFYGTNMDFVEGCPPPDTPNDLGKNPRFEIVAREWLSRKGSAQVITEARAFGHSGLCLDFRAR